MPNRCGRGCCDVYPDNKIVQEKKGKPRDNNASIIKSENTIFPSLNAEKKSAQTKKICKSLLKYLQRLLIN